MAENSAKNTSAKDILKQLAPCWIILFAFCYMLFIYEPLIMYGTNKDDFWFDFGIMGPPMLCIFFMFFLGSAAVLTGLFFLTRRLSKKAKPYRITLSAVFLIFIVLYIQGNVFIGHLPALDGSEIDWSVYTGDNIITLIIFVVLCSAWIFAVLKLGFEKLIKYASVVSLALVVMLSVSMVAVSARNDLFKSKNNLICTTEGFNTASSDKNFFIFMVDSQSATEFTQVISELEELSHAFDDFTYYPDTLSTYAYTRDSVPFVLSGKVNKNEEDFGDYSQHALNGSMLFEELDKRDYSISLYDGELAWYGEKDFEIKNDPNSDNVTLKFDKFFENEMRYVWFKHLPYAFKKASGIDKLDFGSSIDKFDWRNEVLYNEFKNVVISKSDGAHFSFIHAEGAHVPLDMDENFNRIGNGTYLQKTTATAKLIAAFIERLKENGIYDNSVIMIMADHGYQPAQGQPDNYILSRFNPILLIKGIGEKHDLVYSDKPVSYLDLPQAYIDLLDGKQSLELFPEAEYPRTRTVIWYEYNKEEHMAEYVTDGKATEWDKFRETGEIFDLTKK